jgi:hypothetical protein
MTGNRIGELNGRWALLLKVTLVAVPVLTTIVVAVFMPWSVWVTDGVYSSRATEQIVVRLSGECVEMKTVIESLPPLEWKERIRELEADSKQNFKDHSSILISLEQIKAAVGVLDVTPSGK